MDEPLDDGLDGPLDGPPGGPLGGPPGDEVDDGPARLVTVLLTLAVPAAADAEDAAALAADAAASTALRVVHAVGVEGHLPAPGATVVRAGPRGPDLRQPWTVQALTPTAARLRDLAGDVVEVPRASLLPDPLETGERRAAGL